jgi:hypothetical protein
LQPSFTPPDAYIRLLQIDIGLIAGGFALCATALLLLLLCAGGAAVSARTNAVLTRCDFLYTRHTYPTPGPLLTKRTPLGGYLTLLAVLAMLTVTATLTTLYVYEETAASTLQPGNVVTENSAGTQLRLSLTLLDAAGRCDAGTVAVAVSNVRPAGELAVLRALDSGGTCALQWQCTACALTDQTASVTFAMNASDAAAFWWQAVAQSYDPAQPSSIGRTEFAPSGTRWGGADPAAIRASSLFAFYVFFFRFLWDMLSDCAAELSVMQAVQTRGSQVSSGGLVQFLSVVPASTLTADTAAMTAHSLSVSFQLQRSALRQSVTITGNASPFTLLGQLFAYLSGVFTVAGVTLGLLERLLRCIARRSPARAPLNEVDAERKQPLLE